jgi:hypothetical protein
MAIASWQLLVRISTNPMCTDDCVSLDNDAVDRLGALKA